MLMLMGKRDTDLETDAELWARIARSARPLKKGRAAAAGTPRKAPARPPVKETSAPPVKPAPKTPAKAAPVVRGEPLNRQTSRQLEKGRLPVEARLDLHGMRQREAHAALRRFLKSAQGKGHRHVLVITGKGADPDETKPFYEDDERGVLRQAVPHWLSQPDLAQMIVSYSEAPRRLGGEGALYVRLRKGRSLR
ncbi:MAG: Smr/MutS family protein [Methyloceanibacter sp.]